MAGATSPIGVVPGFAAIGYEIDLGEPQVSQVPQMPFLAASTSCNAGTFSTNSGATAAVSSYGTSTTCNFFIGPLGLDVDLVFKELELPIFGSSVNGTGSVSQGHMLGIYLNSTTANFSTSGTCLSLVASGMWNMIGSQNSVTAQTAKWWWGGDSVNNLESTAGNLAADITGPVQVHLINGTVPYTLTEGNYYAVHGFTNSTVGANVMQADGCYYSAGSNVTVGAVYYGSSGVITPPVEKYLGSFTALATTSASTSSVTATGLNCLPTTFASSIITNSGGTSQWRYPIPILYW